MSSSTASVSSRFSPNIFRLFVLNAMKVWREDSFLGLYFVSGCVPLCRCFHWWDTHAFVASWFGESRWLRKKNTGNPPAFPVHFFHLICVLYKDRKEKLKQNKTTQNDFFSTTPKRQR